MATQLIHNEKGQINIVLNDNYKRTKIEDEQESLNTIQSLQFIDDHLSSFIGLTTLKKIVKEIYAIRLINEKRKQVGLQEQKQVLHMMFKGNPGTGKTTVARSLATLFYEMNILSKGHFIEVERSDLVGEYIGQTAQKTKNIVQKALGGILFIDEAYSLARGGHKDFGREAIDSLVKYMEDYQHEFILILAGYPHEMEQFLRLNPGLASRLPFMIDFNDYDVMQLINIAKILANKQQYEFSQGAIQKLTHHLKQKINEQQTHFANGRYVRNIVEDAIRSHAVRLLRKQQFSVNDLTILTKDDISFSSE